MADPAHEAADAALEAFAAEVRGKYAEAEKTARERLTEHLERFAEQDEARRREWKDGLISKKAYTNWRKRQMLAGKRYRALLDQIADGYANAEVYAMAALNGVLPEVMAENANWALYELDSQGIGTSWALTNADTVSGLLVDGESALPKMSEGKAYAAAWNRQAVSNTVLQGVLLGESVPKIAARMAKVTGTGLSSVMRVARTSITAAENAGRVAQYQRARDELGVQLEKRWVATLDGRTRHSHRLLDGEQIPQDQKFSNDLMYPGESSGPYSEIMNCRCTLMAVVAGVDMSDAERWSRGVEDYEAWKAGK